MRARSLRARLTIGVVALAALGLFVAGAVTYAEQRSSLYDRIDEQVRSAIGVVGDEIVAKGIRNRDGLGRPGGPAPGVAPERPRGRGDRGDRGDRGPGGGGPGSENRSIALYGEARDAAGRVLGSVLPQLPSGETAPAKPKLPARIAIDEPFTVSATGGGGLRYRVIAQPAPDGGMTVAALPLTEVDATLSQLLLIEGLVFSGVLIALGFGAWWIVRLGLRPLDAIGVTAGAIAAGDLTRRVEPRRAAHRGRPPRACRSTRCWRGWRRRSPSAARARSACAASWPTPRTSCARRCRRSAATPSCSGSAPRQSPRTSRRR